MTSSLRVLLRDAMITGALSLGVAACSAPTTDALTRSSGEAPLTHSLSAASTAPAPTSSAKARTALTSKESLGGSAPSGPCPSGMASIDGRFCIDRFEATLVDVLSNGDERAHSPFAPVDPQQQVRAVSVAGAFPQGYISAVEAMRACGQSGKRLCKVQEWGAACRGPDVQAWGYGDHREPGRCNDRGKNPVLSLYGAGHWNWKTMNQPDLNQLESTLAKTGSHEGCTNGYGVFDMVGNLHEWVADPSGTFYGGYYQDVASVGHGEGCGYLTTAHEARYHDYSTGFRCCADLPGANRSPAPPAAKKPRR